MDQADSFEEFSRKVREQGFLKRTYGFYLVTILIVFCGVGASFFLITFTDNLWIQIANAAFLSFILVQGGLVAHDLSHGQVFEEKKYNVFFAHIAWGLFGGLSASQWYKKHNAHHQEVNRIGHDPDIVIPFIFSEKQLKTQSFFVRTFLLPFQHILFFILLPFVYPNMMLAGVLHISKQYSVRAAVDFFFIVLHFVIIFSLPLLFLPLLVAIVFFVIHFLVAGVYMGLVFAPNHKGEVVRDEEEGTTWKDQIISTRNIIGGRISFTLFGALNLQIEHHLFPYMARPLYLKVQPLVREFCKHEGLPYHETTLGGSLSEMYRALSRTKNLSKN